MHDTWYMYLGVDIGATKTLLAIGSSPMELIEQKKFPTPNNPGIFSNNLRRLASGMDNIDDVKAAVVAVPGQTEGSKLVQAGRLPWHDIEIKKVFTWLDTPLYVHNDATLGGLAEARHGAGRDARQLLYVTISTGIGSGIIVDKAIPDFIRGSEGGHAIIDYVHGKSFEQLASGSAFYERYGRLGKEVDDPKIWQDYGKLLGAGIYNMMTLTEPDVIVIGGSMGVFFKNYQAALKKEMQALNRFSIPAPEIRAAKFPSTAVVRGCISYAMEACSA